MGLLFSQTSLLIKSKNSIPPLPALKIRIDSRYDGKLVCWRIFKIITNVNTLLQHIDDKIKEAEFFYNKILENYEKEEVRYYINAFLTSTRSIFYFLKTLVELRKKPVNHKKWFWGEINKLEENKVWKTLTEKRNLVVHVYNEDLGYSIRWQFGSFTDELILAKGESWKDAIIAREEESKVTVKTFEGEKEKGKGEFFLRFEGLDEYELRAACSKYLELTKQLAKKVKDRFDEDL